MRLDVDPGDLHPGEGVERFAEARARFALEEVLDPGSDAFDVAFRAMADFFEPRGEIERRAVLESWLSDPPRGGAVRVRYHVLLARDARDGRLAGVRDCFVALDPAAGRCVVLLSHSLVLPEFRRSGLAGLLRTAPATLARRSVAEHGLAPGRVPIALMAEMEPVDPLDPGTLVRLIAYGRAGYAVVPPEALPYCQPDFRDLDAAGEDQRPIPMLAVVRLLGEERRLALPRAMAAALVTHLHAIHLRAARPADLAVLRDRTLAALERDGRDPVPLLPLPGDASRAEGLAPFLRSAVHPHYPEALRAPPRAPAVDAALLRAAVPLLSRGRAMNTPHPRVPGEPEAIRLRTAVPGPRSEALRARHGRHQDARTVFVYQDARESRGSYLVDVDGNALLDVFGHIAALPIGYNHPALLDAWRGGRFDWAAGYRPALGFAPPAEWVDLVEGTLMRLAPAGMDRVFTMTTGSEAVENALKASFIRMARRLRGGAEPTASDLEASMENRQAGVDRWKVISFEGGFHGRSMGALSATRSKPIHKLDIPAFDWPMVPFPALRYPLDAHAAENRAAEARSLEALEAAVRAEGGRVAAVIVEPIQGEGGDRHASPAFFRGVRALTREHGAALVVDEVQTGGGATGRFWAHEGWGLEDPPDLVTFSKKMQVGGYYCRAEFAPPETYRIYNTFLGDPLRAAQLQVIAEVIESEGLLARVEDSGAALASGLGALCAEHPALLSGARAAGTFAAVDVRDAGARDRLVLAVRRRGLVAGGSGERTVRFRPPLVFTPGHAAEALDVLDAAARELE